MINWHNSYNTLLFANPFLNLFGPDTDPLLLNDNWLLYIYLNINLLYQLFKYFKNLAFHNWLNLEMIVCVCVCVRACVCGRGVGGGGG